MRELPSDCKWSIVHVDHVATRAMARRMVAQWRGMRDTHGHVSLLLADGAMARIDEVVTRDRRGDDGWSVLFLRAVRYVRGPQGGVIRAS